MIHQVSALKIILFTSYGCWCEMLIVFNKRLNAFDINQCPFVNFLDYLATF